MNSDAVNLVNFYRYLEKVQHFPFWWTNHVITVAIWAYFISLTAIIRLYNNYHKRWLQTSKSIVHIATTPFPVNANHRGITT